jgi:hypothetical protein
MSFLQFFVPRRQIIGGFLDHCSTQITRLLGRAPAVRTMSSCEFAFAVPGVVRQDRILQHACHRAPIKSLSYQSRRRSKAGLLPSLN